ncbi:CaiB/BaiF CoA-transferase family protein [uncultured Oscillibacter sp.]|uniref:CaiB/BaiF CoA transferase family protein n=1 Tax=uncultured Oscillibacter sp. TaxID=876091 RepID=UPI002628E6F6|nr:CoA transferase [uncultured Oscillibacter sp.]
MHNIAMDGVVVLDLSRVVSGPFASMLMADMGARVIKVEMPGSGDDTRLFGPLIQGESPYFMTLNRNKESITLNLKTQKGKDILWKLVEKADIVIENFRPGVLDRLGFGYEALKKAKPQIVLGSISGFGQNGPYAGRPGYDILGQAMSGIMSVTGWPGGKPTRVNTALCDILSGLSLAVGVLGAYSNAVKTGAGQHVDVSLVDSGVAALCTINHIYLSTGVVPGLTGNRDGVLSPFASYQCKDGSIILACGNDRLFGQLCAVIGQPDMAGNPRFVTNEARMAHNDELQEILENWLAEKTAAEAVGLFLDAGIPAGPINTIDQVAADPHIAGAREMFPRIHHPVLGDMRITGSHLKLSDTPTSVRKLPPALGEDNVQVYQDFLGISSMEIEQLKVEGVI